MTRRPGRGPSGARHRLAPVVGLAILGAGALGGVAAAATPTPGGIGPHQPFAGEVNGRMAHAVVQVVCPGPAVTHGRALAGQTLEVVPAPAISTSGGNTGAKGDRIVAQIGPSAAAVGAVVFTRYGEPEPFPTDVPVPCGGTGLVRFVPEPSGAGAHAATVTVTYANVAVSPGNGTERGRAAVSSAPPHITAHPSSVMVDQDTRLTGRNFAPHATLQVTECSETSWIVPQSPCDTTNTVTVTTNAKGGFKASLEALVCPGTGGSSPGFAERCYVGVPQPFGVDQVRLLGAAAITVTGP